MGVGIGDILKSEEINFDDLEDMVMTVDAYNIIYQFLSSIRQRDGKPLKDSEGRVTSHLSGILYRNANLVGAGIKPVYVFDGAPDMMKEGTLEKRKERKKRAKKEYEKSLEKGDLERARIKAQQTSRMTDEIEESSKKLLSLLAIPWIQAPSEGESQAAHIVRNGDAWGVASQDHDTLLFGANRLVKNLTVTGKRKMPGSSDYKKISPELIELEEVLNDLDITRKQLVDIGILCGTDYNEGVKGIGPKRGLKYIKKYNDLESVLEEKDAQIDNYEAIQEIFLDPDVKDDYTIRFEDELGDVKGFLCDERDFSEGRVESALKKFEKGMERRKQSSLLSFD
ncbi:MAG: flap endonuclease-1 [Candidatus Thermoplasmatota archaeon]|nr:flap endonuclease-1 [Candidatus Thermoplasmatota archaeon]MBS3789730.1 flap endonuclease-1 [Candidatus Thermoplasmatota archaeon]